MSTKFTLPPLPYAYDALGPYMSAETLEFHHDKHHQAYVTNGEKLLEGSGLEILPLEDIVKEAFGKNAGLFNNAGQHYNHVHFWNWMKPNGGGKSLPAKLQAAIDSDLGGFDKFRADFIAAGTTQFGSASALVNQTQDGYGAGSLQSFSVDSTGRISGRFSNGQLRTLAQVVLARFPDPISLIRTGKNTFAQSGNSGQAITAAPDSAGMGKVVASSLELSNVDLGQSFIDMITAQRGFQANSRVISTTDEILQELVNLKR